MKLSSTAAFNPLFLKILNNFFFIFSESGPDRFSIQLQPSSLYKPTNSHNSEPS